VPVEHTAIVEAQQRLRGILYPTPLLPSGTLDGSNGTDVEPFLLKPECLQRTGSFKIRGAYNKMARLSPTERAAGVITFSSGNHAQAVAAAGRLLGISVRVVMPEDAVPAKLAATRAQHAAVILHGKDSLSRERLARQLAAERSWAIVPPYDDGEVIAGQGTIGLEILAEAPDADVVVIPVGGGGLIAGVATAVKHLRPETRIIGVEPEGAADARDSLHEGHIVELPSIVTIADGLRHSRVGQLTFDIIRELVDDIVTVEEQQIVSAVRTLIRDRHLVVEPSGAVGVAAVLAGKVRQGTRTVAVVSGGNIDTALLKRIVDGGDAEL
jgi:threonine dehydratase